MYHILTLIIQESISYGISSILSLGYENVCENSSIGTMDMPFIANNHKYYYNLSSTS